LAPAQDISQIERDYEFEEMDEMVVNAEIKVSNFHKNEVTAISNQQFFNQLK
jgi:hypothetical protein